tara:strand:- start:57 stop:548 length:492 start_codon:yes stop_codon:yes gene_type:complete
MKTLFILIGPKGSGKTYIGTLIQKKLNILFFRVEDVWLSIKTNKIDKEYLEKGFSLVEKEIDKQFKKINKLIIESTAAFDYFKIFLKKLESKYNIKLIQVKTPLDLCLDRIKSRDQSIHIPVSDDRIQEINSKAVNVKFDFDLIIENSDISEDQIIKEFSSLL